MSFSKRYGFEREKIIQKDEVDEELRISLLNKIYIYFFKNSIYNSLNCMEEIWIDILKKDVSVFEIYMSSNSKFDLLKDEFNNVEWYKIYDIIEIIINYDQSKKDRLISDFNQILKRENSAYRIIDSQVVMITDEIEIQEIEECLNIDDKFMDIVREELDRCRKKYLEN